MRRKIKKNFFAYLLNNSNICNEFNKHNKNIPLMLKKVFLSLVFVLAFSISIIGGFSLNAYSTENIIEHPIVILEGEYTKEYVMIDGVLWCLIYDDEDKLIQAYPVEDGGN